MMRTLLDLGWENTNNLRIELWSGGKGVCMEMMCML